jgi:fermentation-respiration switch protein FrsA (DUF1100 family)
LAKSDSFGGVAPAGLFQQGADLTPITKALDANDAETLKIRTPVRIEQGKADATVFPQFTDQLFGELKGKGVTVTYKTYDGVDHGEAVTAKPPSADATKFIGARF